MFALLPSDFAAAVLVRSRYGCALGGAGRQLQSERKTTDSHFRFTKSKSESTRQADPGVATHPSPAAV